LFCFTIQELRPAGVWGEGKVNEPKIANFQLEIAHLNHWKVAWGSAQNAGNGKMVNGPKRKSIPTAASPFPRIRVRALRAHNSGYKQLLAFVRVRQARSKHFNPARQDVGRYCSSCLAFLFFSVTRDFFHLPRYFFALLCTSSPTGHPFKLLSKQATS
jgi:hypothetical protein